MEKYCHVSIAEVGTRTSTGTRRRETSHYTSLTAGIVPLQRPEPAGALPSLGPAGPFRQAEFSSPYCNEAPRAAPDSGPLMHGCTSFWSAWATLEPRVWPPTVFRHLA